MAVACPEYLIFMDHIENKISILRELAKSPTLSQRELSLKVGISLGKVNYVLKALIEKGHIKTENFKNSKNKLQYMYILTPSGIEERMRLILSFLKRKMKEYDRLKVEIKNLKSEVKDLP